MNKEQSIKEKGKLYDMYGNFVQVPYVWYKLCRKYEIPKEVAVLKTKGNTIEINPMEINVLAYLAGYNLEPDKECFPGNVKLATTFDVGLSTIEKYLKELRWVGFIKTFEEKSTPVHTDRRTIYVQFDVINSVLESESNPYKCMVPSKCMPYEHMDKPIQTNGITHTDRGENPYELATYNKELERIRKNNKDTAPPKDNNSFITPDGDATKEKRSLSDISDQECQEMFDKYNSGQTMEELMEEYNTSWDVVSEALKYILLG